MDSMQLPQGQGCHRGRAATGAGLPQGQGCHRGRAATWLAGKSPK